MKSLAVLVAYVTAVMFVLALCPGCDGGGGGGGGGGGTPPVGPTQNTGDSTVGAVQGAVQSVAQAMEGANFAVGAMEEGFEKQNSCASPQYSSPETTLLIVSLTFDDCDIQQLDKTVHVDGTLEIRARDPFYSGADPQGDLGGAFNPTVFDITFDHLSYEEIPAGASEPSLFYSADALIHIEYPLTYPGSVSFNATGVLEAHITEDGEVHFRVTYEDFSVVALMNTPNEPVSFTANGTLTYENLLIPPPNNVIRVTYDNFSATVDETLTGTTYTFDGGISSDCIGDVSVETLVPVFVPEGSDCPTAGVIQLVDTATSTILYQITFRQDGSVEIRDMQTGAVHTLSSCQDYELCGS